LPVSAQQPSAGDRASGRFTLETIKRSYNLKAADGADMDDWTTSIREVIARADTAAGDEVSNADGACKGWLWKQTRGGVRRHWKRRFVVLTTPAPGAVGEMPPHLTYHIEEGGEARGKILLNTSDITLEVFQRKPGERHGWTFEISTWDTGEGASEHLVLSTESSAVLEAWVGALKAAVPHLRPPQDLDGGGGGDDGVRDGGGGGGGGGGFGQLQEVEMQALSPTRPQAPQEQQQQPASPEVIEQDFFSFVSSNPERPHPAGGSEIVRSVDATLI
jgi:hypothetical protein